MKKILLMAIVMATTNLFSQTGNVGIGTATPYSSAILDLTATDKALLLPRVANAAAVATPTNGMMVYDISQKCVIGYENNTWSACLSNTGGGGTTPPVGGEWGFDFTSTAKFITSQGSSSGLISTDGKVFIWGVNTGAYWNPLPGNLLFSSTPVYIPLPAGEVAEKLQFHGASGEFARVITSSGKVYQMSVRVWVQITNINEPTGFQDIAINGSFDYKLLLGKSGKAYNDAVQIPFPAGVTAFTKIWATNNNTGFAAKSVFFKGNDNNIYGLNTNGGSELGVGNTNPIPLNATPVKLPFPVGVNIVNMIPSNNYSLALASDGNAYGFGIWTNGGSSPKFACSPLAANLVGDRITIPSPINIPTGSTRFTALYAFPRGSIVKTDVSTFIKGLNESRILMDPISGNSNDSTPFVDSDLANYNVTSPALNNFKFLFPDAGQTVFAIGNNDRAYFWGFTNTVGTAGIGGGPNKSGESQMRPVPIATGLGDPRNPNPFY